MYKTRPLPDTSCRFPLQVAKSFEGENDRVKMFLLYCTDEDVAIVRAGAGGLAMLSDSATICHKIITVSLPFVFRVNSSVTIYVLSTES